MILVIKGIAAINRGKDEWIGIIEGNRYCDRLRKYPSQALRDAKRLLKKSQNG